MPLPDRSLIYAIGIAFLAHAALFVGVRWAPEPAPVTGASGMRLALAPSSPVATSSDNLNVETSEQEPVPEEVRPVRVPEPIVERKPEPVPEPEVPVRRAAEPAAAPQPAASTESAQLPESAGTSDAAGTADAAGESSVGNSVAQANYEAQVASWLDRNKRYPRLARRRRQEGVVFLEFTVTRDGLVTESRIIEGSGYRLLDREVEALIERAQPLPSFPDSVSRPHLKVRIPIRFSLDQR